MQNFACRVDGHHVGGEEISHHFLIVKDILLYIVFLHQMLLQRMAVEKESTAVEAGELFVDIVKVPKEMTFQIKVQITFTAEEQLSFLRSISFGISGLLVDFQGRQQ